MPFHKELTVYILKGNIWKHACESVLLNFKIFAKLIGEKWHQCSFHLHFSRWKTVSLSNFFMLKDNLYIFVKYKNVFLCFQFTSFAYFFILVSGLFFSQFLRIIYILDISALYLPHCCKQLLRIYHLSPDIFFSSFFSFYGCIWAIWKFLG